MASDDDSIHGGDLAWDCGPSNVVARVLKTVGSIDVEREFAAKSEPHGLGRGASFSWIAARHDGNVAFQRDGNV